MTKKIPNSEDSDLFRQAVGKVRAVTSDKVPPARSSKPKPYPKTKALDLEASSLPSEYTETELEKLGLGDSMSFLAPGLQTNVLKKMRQGYFGLDASIDLHGLTSTAARQQLLGFLHDCVQRGCRCVHIIHGKGYRSEDNHPVLKNNLNLWLRQHASVQAFCSASPKDGGTGAVLVLLQVK